MAKKNKTGGTASHKGPQSPLRAFALVAAISTLILVILDAGLFVTYMLYHFCVTQLWHPSPFQIGAIFYSNYIAGDSCMYSDGTSITLEWLEFGIADQPPIESSFHPYNATNSDNTLIWMIVGLVLDIFWLASSISLYSKKKLRTRISSSFYPWLYLTTLVLCFQLIGTCWYGTELKTYMNLQYADLTGLESEVKNQLIAILILPLYFSKGVIIWFYFLILLIIGWVKVEKEKKNLLKAPTMFGNNSRNGNPLDGGNNQVLNRRALDLSNDHDNFSDDERDAPYFNNGLNLLKQASERRTSGNWMFANDGFEPEYAAPFGQTESGLQPHLPESNFTNPYMVSSVPGYNTVQPGTHLSSNYEQSGSQRPLTIQESLDITLRNRPRKLSDTYMSDVDSVVSEYDRDHRRLGRPVIPERDYPLPRAHSKRSSGSRSIIRTPSGKYSSASDYLRGYTPQEAPVMEEDYDHQERYYVKLKD